MGIEYRGIITMLRVMIVEDEDMIRKGLVFTIDWLSMDCVVVAEASNGQEGYERILEYKPDVVIADICMPFMDGIEMIQKASEKVKFKSILLTSYAEFDYARRAIEARVCEYLLKPVDEERDHQRASGRICHGTGRVRRRQPEPGILYETGPFRKWLCFKAVGSHPDAVWREAEY